ncbi:MAG: hypothetical protein WAS27_00990 [Candidatus Saccharimonadales bacterium]
MEINTLALRAFYETHKDSYYTARQSGDASKWDERYKWDILPALNEVLSHYQSVSADTIGAIVQELRRNNPSQGSFAHWIDMDDLSTLAEKPNGWQVLNTIWQATPDSVADEIRSANMMSGLLTVDSKKFSPSTYGFMLAARDCSKFAVYRDTVAKRLADINNMKLSSDQGDKYKFLNDAALYVGELMQSDALAAGLEYRALNGQDFFWLTLSAD